MTILYDLAKYLKQRRYFVRNFFYRIDSTEQLMVSSSRCNISIVGGVLVVVKRLKLMSIQPRRSLIIIFWSKQNKAAKKGQSNKKQFGHKKCDVMLTQRVTLCDDKKRSTFYFAMEGEFGMQNQKLY